MKKNAADEKEIIIRDAIIAGVTKTLGLEVSPQYDKTEVTFRIRGDVDLALKKIADNVPVGARDVLEAIKSCRSAIFLFKQGVH
jgi:hypothetical protein